MRVYLAVTEYVADHGLLGFEVREIHDTAAQLLAYDLAKEEMIGLFYVYYNECEEGLASVLPVGEKEYIVQGASKDKANYLTFRVSPVQWSSSFEIKCEEGAMVEYSPRLTLRYQRTESDDNVILSLYDPFAGVVVEEIVVTPDDSDSNSVVVSDIGGQKLAFQGQSWDGVVMHFRITPLTFPPIESESKCNCNR